MGRICIIIANLNPIFQGICCDNSLDFTTPISHSNSGPFLVLGNQIHKRRVTTYRMSYPYKHTIYINYKVVVPIPKKVFNFCE